MRDFLLFVENRDRFAVGLFRQFKIEETPSRVLIITPTLEQKKWVLEYIRARLSDYEKEILVRSQEEGKKLQEDPPKDNLLPSYNFENFVVGKSNQLAYRICLEVSMNPGVYSPLFIYGGVGLGKTHLLHAVGNRARSNGYKALYRQAVEFSEEMIKSLKEGKIETFRKAYSNVDILLLDDVQFLSGKERTQVELFRVFEALQSAEKQIVLVSDRHPKDIRDVSERLLSRFASGLILEIGLDKETKLSIIKNKLLLFGLPTDKRHIDYVMENTGYSVREIEGFIKTLKFTGIREEQPTQALSKEEDLIKHVAKYFNLRTEDLKRETRERKVLKARQTAMYLCRTLLHMSYSEIARLFGKPDHTSALYSIKKVEEKKQQDRKFAYTLEMLEKSIKKHLGLN
ncbi:DnaA ATPase domain-containing protein [Pampinifervens florentissimum]|uniref:DnaA ATPase domain-containing protein n=1 Tax=Pampinifervens florentissimum TaxID=1632019 RepID=UPI0013B48EA1|nr:DnaA/Hda family protein [Hydrogenobacter sp. T-8]QID33135.1 ATP-binding protein [Hydrogenobacter sp. T-8]